MNIKELENVEEWAVETFRSAELGDPRRTDRLVKVAAALGENPSVSLPRSMRNWADTQGAYRLLNNEAINHEQIMMPHWIQTRSEAEQRSQDVCVSGLTGETEGLRPSTCGNVRTSMTVCAGTADRASPVPTASSPYLLESVALRNLLHICWSRWASPVPTGLVPNTSHLSPPTKVL